MPAPLNDDQIGKYLADPLSFPPEFKNWVVKYLEQHQPNLLIRQLVGTLLPSKIAGYPGAAGKVLAGDGTWPGGMVTIYDQVAPGTVASFDINPIAGTYTHLQIVAHLRGDTAAISTGVRLRFNNDTAAYYDYIYGAASSGGVVSGEGITTTSIYLHECPALNAPANLFSANEVWVPRYTNTTELKNINALSGSRNANTVGTNSIVTAMIHADWLSTAVVTRITLFPAVGNFVAKSTVTVLAASA